MQTNIRKWGNSAGAIIPSAALAKAGFEIGDKVEVEAIEGQIVVRSVTPNYTLDELLAATPASSIELNNEDRAWLNAKPVGKEI